MNSSFQCRTELQEWTSYLQTWAQLKGISRILTPKSTKVNKSWRAQTTCCFLAASSELPGSLPLPSSGWLPFLIIRDFFWCSSSFYLAPSLSLSSTWSWGMNIFPGLGQLGMHSGQQLLYPGGGGGEAGMLTSPRMDPGRQENELTQHPHRHPWGAVYFVQGDEWYQRKQTWNFQILCCWHKNINSALKKKKTRK